MPVEVHGGGTRWAFHDDRRVAIGLAVASGPPVVLRVAAGACAYRAGRRQSEGGATARGAAAAWAGGQNFGSAMSINGAFG